MKYSVGLQVGNENFLSEILNHADDIYEIYFSWGDIPNGRNTFDIFEDKTIWETQNLLNNNLKSIRNANIPLNLLFNANCYGADAMSRSFFNKIGNVIDYINENFSLQSVTTTSPLIAKFIKNNFADIKVRASVNMEIGTIQGMKYLSDYFDSFYIKREYNRNFDKIRELKEWCDNNGKQMFMLANSGCLNYCSAHNFHDNIVAHESEIRKMDNAYVFSGICKEYLKNEENYSNLYDNMNFVRPEDIIKYEDYFEAVKLATRVHSNPSMVLKSYINAKYSGDILRLLEPAHSIYPYVLENGNEIKLVKLNTQEENLYVE